MKLRIQETRKTRNQVMDELESNGYDIVDTGYGDYKYELPKWKNKGYDVKGFYVRTDTPGLKMWVLYGKQLTESIMKESSTKSYWKYNQSEDTLPDGDYYDKNTIKRFRLIPCKTPEECYDDNNSRFSSWAVTELEYPYKEVYCTKDEAYEYLMDYLNQSRYETVNDL